MGKEDLNKATEHIKNVVEHGWKSDAPETEDAEALLAEATVIVYNEVHNHPRFSDEERKILEAALEEIKHTGLANLSEGKKDIQYINGVGGADNFVKFLMIEKAAETIDSPQRMNTLLHNAALMFFHVSGWEQFTDEKNWEMHKRIKKMQAERK